MALKLYNTLTRKKEVFKPIKKRSVGMYTCGLTVYDYGHIGNYRAFVVSDILRRYLEYLGYEVRKVMNITDVDDKTIRGSIRENKNLKEFTKKFEKAFFEDESCLNIKKADRYPKATDHINEMIELISKLLEKGYAYKTGDGIYFNIKKFKDYGKLSHLKIQKLKEGARIDADEYEKENAKDFALWKFYDNEDGDVFWKTKLGKGRPGWHIECSVMSSKYLGQPFDIHTGGVDLIFPHHENEIAQSESANGKKFVNYWVHNAHVIINGKKMSKSMGNYYTIRDILKMNYNPLALRYFYLTAHYRTQLNFTIKNLKNAQNTYRRLKNIISEIRDDKKINKEYLSKFENAINDDLDTPLALRILWKLVRDKKAIGKLQTIKKMDEVLGLDLLKREKINIPSNVKKLVDKREEARKKKDFKTADELRERIKELGWKVDDSEEGPRLSKIEK